MLHFAQTFWMYMHNQITDGEGSRDSVWTALVATESITVRQSWVMICFSFEVEVLEWFWKIPKLASCQLNNTTRKHTLLMFQVSLDYRNVKECESVRDAQVVIAKSFLYANSIKCKWVIMGQNDRRVGLFILLRIECYEPQHQFVFCKHVVAYAASILYLLLCSLFVCWWATGKEWTTWTTQAGFPQRSMNEKNVDGKRLTHSASLGLQLVLWIEVFVQSMQTWAEVTLNGCLAGEYSTIWWVCVNQYIVLEVYYSTASKRIIRYHKVKTRSVCTS